MYSIIIVGKTLIPFLGLEDIEEYKMTVCLLAIWELIKKYIGIFYNIKEAIVKYKLHFLSQQIKADVSLSQSTNSLLKNKIKIN